MCGIYLPLPHGKNPVASTRPKNLSPCFHASSWLPQNQANGYLTLFVAVQLLALLPIYLEQDFLEISKRRREEIENNQILHKYRSKIKDIKLMDSLYPSVMNEDIDIQYIDLPF